MERGRFSFEGLDVYRVAVEALRLWVSKREALRGLPGDLRNQGERALISVVANIAESSGRESVAERRRHLAIARGESNEAGSLVEIAHMIGALDEASREELRARLLRVCVMLTAMMRRGGGGGPGGAGPPPL